MNFQEFREFRLEVLARDPSIVDLAEINIWRSLRYLIPTIRPCSEKHVHRCHLAEAWLDVFELPSQWSKFTMISSGVRHSMSLLLPGASQEGRRTRDAL